MPEQWYYAKGDDKRGPVSVGQLKELAANGELTPSDLVWRDGMAEWTPASSTQGLFPEQSMPPPLPAQAASSRAARAGVRTRRSHGENQQAETSLGVATAALVLGIASLVAWAIPIVGLPVAVTGVVCGAKGLKTPGRSMAIGGLVTGIIGICLSMLNAFAGAMMEMNPGGYQPPAW